MLLRAHERDTKRRACMKLIGICISIVCQDPEETLKASEEVSEMKLQSDAEVNDAVTD